jgi:microcompartment protein CcmL/EutN
VSEQECLGIIETQGLALAAQIADAMLKIRGADEIKLRGIHLLGNGAVAVVISGRTGDVQAAMQLRPELTAQNQAATRRVVIPDCDTDLVTFLSAMRPGGRA